jgi:hypothetical protein
MPKLMITIPITLIVCSLSWVFIEKPMIKMGRWLTRY